MSTLALDTNVLLYVLLNHPQFGAPAASLLQGAYGHLQASELVIPELLGHESIRNDAERRQVDGFVQSQLFTLQPIDRAVLYRAAELRRTYTVSLADALHLASCLVHQATHFITNDQELLKHAIPDILLVNLADAAQLLLQL